MIWAKLPKHDQTLLRELVSTVKDGDDGDENTLGSVSTVDGGVLTGGLEHVVDGGYEIRLFPNRYGGYSDEAITGIIAHELAHVALRHMSMAPSLEIMDRHFPEEYERIKEVHEWEADHRAWIWGFYEEIQETWKTLGHENPPWLVLYEHDDGEETDR